MNKKILFGVIISLTTILLLSSCSFGGLNFWGRLDDNDQEIADSHMDRILEAIENNDKDALKAMFSKNAVAQTEDIDQNVTNLFDYYQGDFMSYIGSGGPVTEEGINDDGTGRKWKRLDSTYDVKTSNGEYRFAIIEFVQDTADADNVGVWSLYIIKMEDDNNPEYAYWGDGKDTPGIGIGLQWVPLP